MPEVPKSGGANHATTNGKAFEMTRESTNCLVFSNMFDSDAVDLNKDPSFFIKVKEEVQEICKDWGKVERIFVELNSAGHVWVKYGGDDARKSAEKTRKELNMCQFDG